MTRSPIAKAVLAAALALVFCLTCIGASRAAGLLAPADGSLPPLQIEDHQVRVVVEDAYVITTIDQRFRNPHGRDLEAVYAFPVPDAAAVAEFTYWIDGKPVTGEVRPKAEAERIYRHERAAGREAAVTSQDGERTFDMKVWPVRANSDVRVRLAYLQPAHVDTGIGRYQYPLEDGGVDEQAQAFWTTQEVVRGSFGFEMLIRSAAPIAALRLPQHPQAEIRRLDEKQWRVRIGRVRSLDAARAGGPGREDSEKNDLQLPRAVPVALAGQVSVLGDGTLPAAAPQRLDGDIVVYWRLSTNTPAGVELVAHKPAADRRGTFMLVLTPGDDLKPLVQGRDWTLVLDKSGSMSGKWGTLVNGVTEGLKRLPAGDRFRLVAFDNQAHALTPGFVPVEPANVARYARVLAGVSPDQGTNMYAGLDAGLAQLDADRASLVVLVTDGVANVGRTTHDNFVKLARRQDVRVFPVIMGNSANRRLLQSIADAFNGTSLSVSNADDVVGALAMLSSKVSHQALHGVTLDLRPVDRDLKVGDITPRAIGSVYRGQQLIAFGHYRGSGEVAVRFAGRLTGQPATYDGTITLPEQAVDNPEVERLWAFSQIERLLRQRAEFGETADIRDGVTQLAVEYGLVTPYTSMLVVREDVMEAMGIDRRNRDRLAAEQTARAQRQAQPVTALRADEAKPVFTGSRAAYSSSAGGGRLASSGGAGSFDPVWLLLSVAAIVALLLAARRRRRQA